MQVGDSASVTCRYSQADITAFLDQAGLAPGNVAGNVHGNIPEPLIGALFSYLLGVKLPGFGTNYLKQDMHFLAPAPAEEALTATVTITRLRPEKHLVDLETLCRTQSGTAICYGRALVLARDVAR